ncbi:MAG: pyruvoyl-dependent arginine decarboxylase, partial [Armatimonadota bacterium]|nr:pyruvoyl-dependent arginine decarboxylase [Armatimonadota bacterium]
MWSVPRAVTVATGAGEGSTEVNAFDRALLDAGIANLNFLRVTSILPAGARLV